MDWSEKSFCLSYSAQSKCKTKSLKPNAYKLQPGESETAAVRLYLLSIQKEKCAWSCTTL
jgi:hypothetical protein